MKPPPRCCVAAGADDRRRPGDHRRLYGRGDQAAVSVLGDRGRTDPDLLAAHQRVAELEHMQDAKADPAAAARDAEHLADHGSGHQPFQHQRATGGELVQRLFLSPLRPHDAVERALEAAGDDVEARLEVVVRMIGWQMLEEELRYRQMARTSLDRWFAQHRKGEREPRPTRPARRNYWNALVVEPLRGTLSDDELAGLIEALGFGWGTEAMIVLYDVVQLDTEAAKRRMLTTCRWILRGALADAGTPGSRRARRPTPAASPPRASRKPR